MTGLTASPKLIKGGLVLIDADTARVLRVMSLQYNADTLTRKFQPQEAGGESGNRVEPTRFKGPAVETITLEADIDATDQLEFPDQNPNAGEFGIQPQLAPLSLRSYAPSPHVRPEHRPRAWMLRLRARVGRRPRPGAARDLPRRLAAAAFLSEPDGDSTLP